MAYPYLPYCKNGHRRTPETTQLSKGRRYCRLCHNQIREDKRTFVNEVLGTKCVDCGDDREEVLQYHHRSRKATRYSNGKQRPLLTLGWIELKDELMHLVRICANCHTLEHRRAA